MQRRVFNDEKSNNNYLEIDSSELIEIISQTFSKGTEGRTRKSSIKILESCTTPKIPRDYCYRNVQIHIILFC